MNSNPNANTLEAANAPQSSKAHNAATPQAKQNAETQFSFAGLIGKIEGFLDWQLVGVFFIWVFLLFTLVQGYKP